MRCASCSPNFRVLQQVLVDEGLQTLGMTQRRHTTDDKTGAAADEISISFSDVLPDKTLP